MRQVRIRIPCKQFLQSELNLGILYNEQWGQLQTNSCYTPFSRGDRIAVERESDDIYRMVGIIEIISETYILFSRNLDRDEALKVMEESPDLQCFGLTFGFPNNTYWGLSVPLGTNIEKIREVLFSRGFFSPQMAQGMDQITFQRHKKFADDVIKKYKLNVPTERMHGNRKKRRLLYSF